MITATAKRTRGVCTMAWNAVNLRVVNYAHADVFDAIRLDLHGRRRISCSVVPDSRSRSQRTSAVKMTPLQTPQQPH